MPDWQRTVFIRAQAQHTVEMSVIVTRELFGDGEEGRTEQKLRLNSDAATT